MSQIRNGFLGAAAVSLMLGAVQFASGHDLIGERQIASNLPATSINRAAKADRITEVKPASVPTRTISLRLNDLAETSVLIRVPLTQVARDAKPPALLPAATPSGKPTIACEPMVSVLTEVAKLLQPGRCVT